MLAGAVKEEIITAPSASLDLLIACTEGVPCVPLASMLMTFGDIHSVTSYDTSVGTPTLEQLLNYDVVLTYSNGYYLDSVQMGNVLADYLDAGGKVIDLMWAMDSEFGLDGRFMDENYTAMKGSGFTFDWACLGSYDVSNPILAGVTNFCDFSVWSVPTQLQTRLW